MKVILLKDIESLGSAGEVVQVKSGFGRNFLIPRNEALIATDTNVAQFVSRPNEHEAGGDVGALVSKHVPSASVVLSKSQPRSWSPIR